MTTKLVADAKNRAARTFLTGLVVDLTVAVAVSILAGIDSINDKAALITFSLSLLKTIVTTACSYVLRRYVDQSKIPTPLPPTDLKVV